MLYLRPRAVCPKFWIVEVNQVMSLYLLHLHMTAAPYVPVYVTSTVLNLLCFGETENIKSLFLPVPFRSVAHVKPHVNPVRATWACMLSCKQQLVCVNVFAAVWGWGGETGSEYLYSRTISHALSLTHIPPDQISFKWWCWDWRHFWGFLPICFSLQKGWK